MIAIFIGLLILFLLLSAFFSSSETALFSIPSTKLKVYKNDQDPRRQLIYKMLSSPRDLLVTVLMMNTLANILIQNTVASLFGNFSTWLLNVGVPLVLTLLFGDILPKLIGLAYNTSYSYLVAPVIFRIQRILLPVRRVLIAITSVISRVSFFFLRPEEEISIDELQHALKTSKHEGVLNEDEAELIRGYLLLKKSHVKELMRPREEVLFFDLEDEPLSKLVHLFVDQQCSRLPVCSEDLDHVVGVITASLFLQHRDKLVSVEDLPKFVKKPFFVHEQMDAEALLSLMYEKKESLALVVDEYGAVSGLIAFEDVVERVIGEIADARDVKAHFTKSSEDVIIASGKMELAEFEEVFSEPLFSENQMVTIGGWLTEQVGDIPKTGSKHQIGGYLFHVLSADAKRVRRIYIRRLSGGN